MPRENRPNYFVLLGIDPDKAWNQASFESLLQTKRALWSRTVLNGVKTSKAVVTAQDAIGRYNDIRYVMADPAKREREREDAHARRADERDQKRTDFERDLRIMMSKGFLWDAEVPALRRSYPELLADPEIADRIDRIPTRGIAEQHVVPAQLDPSKAKRIRDLLDQLGERSLYTLLATVEPGVGERATHERLAGAANALYQQTQRDMNKQDPRLLARQELAGHAMQVFGSAADRDRYDSTLAVAPVTALIAKYQTALAPIKRIETGQVEQFLAEAAAAGADAEVALAMLLKHFETLKWTVLPPADALQQASDDQVRCAACQAWNDKDNEFCAVCGTRSRIECPSCGHAVPGHGACARCGFPVGDHDWATLLVRECAESLDRQDLPGAEDKLAAAARAWPSDGEDELAERVRQCRTAVAQLREKRTAEDSSAARRLHTLVGQRNYHAALAKANSAPTSVPDRERVIEEAKAHIGKADRLCDTANRPGTSTRQQVEYYTQALTHCADHARAQRALGALPPEPPRELRAEPTGSTVRLTWQPPASDDVRYVVVRKPGAVPVSVSDGTRVATVRRTTYEDTTPDSGVPLHYAVFAQRRTGTTSERAAATERPVFRTGQVVITAQRVDDGVVELEWQLPVNATGVAVRRTAGGTTTDVGAPEQTRLRDETVTNGVSCTYTLRARYPGTDELSAGTSVTLIPGPSPESPGPVHVRTVTRNLGLCYRLVDLLPQGAAPGTARVLWTQHRLPVRPGEQRPVTELARFGALLAETDALGFALPRQGLYYFVQVMIQQGSAYFGDVRRYAARDEIGEVSARNLGDTIRLTWTWPDGSTAALVAYDHDEWPADPAVAPHQVLVERIGNDHTGTCDVVGTTPEREQIFRFVVASAESADGEVFVSTGTRCAARLTPQQQNPSRRSRRKRR